MSRRGRCVGRHRWWARGPRCLLFGSEVAIRRVWHYPADWRTLTDAALEAVSWRV